MENAEIERLVARVRLPDALETDVFLAARQSESNGKSRLRLTCDLEAAKRLARRALEVGIYQADFAERSQFGPISNDLVKVARLAERASAALAALMGALDSQASGPRDFERAVLTASDNRDAHSAHYAHFRARQRAKHIWRARHACDALLDSLDARSGRLKKGAENPGKPIERAFVEVIAEAWVVLFGQANFKNPTDASPFVQFAKLAWQDAFESSDAPEMSGAVRSLAFPAARIAQLRERGPDWK